MRPGQVPPSRPGLPHVRAPSRPAAGLRDGRPMAGLRRSSVTTPARSRRCTEPPPPPRSRGRARTGRHRDHRGKRGCQDTLAAQTAGPAADDGRQRRRHPADHRHRTLPGSTSGTLTWWERSGSTWRTAGTAPARFGSHGLAEGATRSRTPVPPRPACTGSRSPSATAPRPPGPPCPTAPSPRPPGGARTPPPPPTTAGSARCRPTARPSESEHLADYPTQYAHAVLIDFNYTSPVKGRGAGIFLHVNGRGATAGCVSVPADALDRVMAWLKPAPTRTSRSAPQAARWTSPATDPSPGGAPRAARPEPPGSPGATWGPAPPTLACRGW